MLKPDKLTAYELFKMERRFVVPLFQRPYVWTQEARWEPLWEDIEDKAEAFERGESPSPHFLGAVVLAQLKVGIRQVAAAQIIDGQQRLTTLQVFLAAFRDVLARATASEPDDETKQVAGTIKNKLDGVTEHANVLGAAEDKFKVWPTNADRRVYQDVMTAGSIQGLSTKYPLEYQGKKKKTVVPGPPLVDAYRYFTLKVDAFLRAPGPSGPRALKDAALNLFATINNALQFVVIDLDEHDDPQVIFETLNARGEPLLPSDLIRNLVFRTATTDAEQLYEDHWKPFDEQSSDGGAGFWKEKVKQGREFRPRLDLFFHHFLTVQSDRMVPIGHLYEGFRQWWSAKASTPTAMSSTLGTLRKFSECFREISEPDRLRKIAPRMAALAEKLPILDVGTIIPLLLFVRAEMVAPQQEKDGMLTDLESFLVRRWIARVSTKNYNRVFTSLLNDARSTGVTTRAQLKAKLKAGTGVDRWPDDAEFQTVWMHEPAYERLNSPGIQMVFRAIHDAQIGPKQEAIALPTSLDVEHVMPKAWRNNWGAPPTTTPSTPGDETAEERRDRMIHTFGNLTLLTQPLNISVRDGAFATKRPEITKNSLLLFNSYFQDKQTWPRWTPKSGQSWTPENRPV